MIAFKIRRISALLGSDIISLFYQQFTLSIPSYQQYMFFFPLFCQQCTLSFRCFANNAHSHFVVYQKFTQFRLTAERNLFLIFVVYRRCFKWWP